MKYQAVLLVLFFSISSYAQVNCKKWPKYNTSLRSKGKPLHNYQVQDQDGLGTCYANTLSTMLFSHIGKQISAHHIAAANGMQKQDIEYFDEKRAKGQILADGKYKNIEESGEICKSFEAIQDRISMCSRHDVYYETLLKDPGHKQKQLHNALAKLYDNADELKSLSKEQVLKLVKSLKELKQSNTTKENNYIIYDMCKLDLENLLENSTPIFSSQKDCFFDFLQSSCINLDDEIKSLKVKKESLLKSKRFSKEIEIITKRIQKLESRLNSLGEVKQIDSQSKTCNLQPSVANAHVKYLKDVYDHFNSSGVAKRLGSTTSSNARDYYIDGKMSIPINNFLNSFQKLEDDDSWPGEMFLKNGTKLSENELKSLFAGDINNIIPDLCTNSESILSSGDFYQTQLAKDGFCFSDNTTQGIIQLIGAMGLSDDSNNTLNQLNAIISGLDKTYDDYLMGIISPNCRKSGREISNSEYANLKCKDEDLFIATTSQLKTFWKELSKQEQIEMIKQYTKKFRKDLNPENVGNDLMSMDTTHNSEIFKLLLKEEKRFLSKSFYLKSPKELQRKMKSEQKRMNKIVSSKLRKGKSIGLAICSKVLLKKSSFEDSTNCDGNALPGKQGPHAVNIIGQRCGPNGVIEYQIQNSWGQGCSSSIYECSPNDGTLWIPEDQLVQNSLRISIID